MKKYFNPIPKGILCTCLCLMTVSLFGQNNVVDPAVQVNGLTISYRTYEAKQAKITGSIYMYSNWFVGNVKLTNGEVFENHPLKYDLRSNVLEFRFNDKVKMINAIMIETFDWVNLNGDIERFISANSFMKFKEENTFLEVLTENSDTKLLVNHSLKLIQGNYNSTLLVGSKENKYVKKEKYYLFQDKEVIEFKANKKHVLKLMGKHANQVNTYAKEKLLKYNQRLHLKEIFDYYFSLIEKA